MLNGVDEPRVMGRADRRSGTRGRGRRFGKRRVLGGLVAVAVAPSAIRCRPPKLHVRVVAYVLFDGGRKIRFCGNWNLSTAIERSPVWRLGTFSAGERVVPRRPARPLGRGPAPASRGSINKTSCLGTPRVRPRGTPKQPRCCNARRTAVATR